MQRLTGTISLIIISSILVLITVSCGVLNRLGFGEQETPTAAVADAQSAREVIPTSTPLPTPTPEATATGLPTEIIEQISPISPVSPITTTLRQSIVSQLKMSAEIIPGSEEALAAAVEDLSERTGVSPDQITLVSMEAVEWRDSSLGCPQEGFMYAQVITPGFTIVLEADGQEYIYHTDQRSNAVLCEN
jgi:hypothetical protein